MDLTDQQWTIIEPLFEEKRRSDGRGRPWRDARAVLNGVLWVVMPSRPLKRNSNQALQERDSDDSGEHCRRAEESGLLIT
jgi:hypothetical protein